MKIIQLEIAFLSIYFIFKALGITGTEEKCFCKNLEIGVTVSGPQAPFSTLF